ncbi:MAG: hypothetical protein K5640_07465 [Treponema sp.]|nr:hypothetical protein [Treponema sp.]
MKNKKVGIVSFIITIIFILTVCNLIFAISTAYRTNSKNAPEVYSTISRKLSDLSSRIPVEDKSFIPNFINIVASQENISAFKIEYNGIKLYEFPAVPANEASPLIKNYTSKIESPDGTLTLGVSFYLVSPEVIFNHARIAFFIILIGTLTIAIMLLYLYLCDKDTEPSDIEDDEFYQLQTEQSVDNPSEKTAVSADEEPKTSEQSVSASIQNQTQPVIELEQTEQKGQNVVPAQSVSAAPTSIETELPQKEPVTPESVTNEPAISEPLTSTPAEPMVEKQNEIEEVALQTASNTNTAESSLYETSLSSKLNEELINSSSDAKDLALYIIRVPNTPFTSDLKETIHALLVKQFEEEDKIFNFYSDGFAVIQEVENLDFALSQAETFHNSLVEKLNEKGINQIPVIGISSKSLRLLSADRLITEAEQAERHAESDLDSPIVAFRVNPDKYRKFMAETSD